MGSAEGGHPDLFRFVPLVFGTAPICSDLLRFLPICFQNKSEKSGKPLSADPLCKSPKKGPNSQKEVYKPVRGRYVNRPLFWDDHGYSPDK